MAYATKEAMIARFGEAELIQLTDRAVPAAGAIDDAVLVGAMTDADMESDASIGARYTLPLTEVPPVVTRIACDLARYFLFDKAAPEEVRNRAKDARDLLRRIAKGEVSLGLDTAPPTVESPVVSNPGRTWDFGSLGDF